MAGYEDTYKKIVDTLTGRPAGHEIQPYEHEAFALSLLDYIRSVETATNSMFAGSANGSTTPIQPPTSNVAYLSTVSGGSTVTYTKFKDVNGNSITVTCAANKGKVVILMWNKQYWSSQEVEVEANVPSPVGMAFMGIADTTTVPPSGTSWAYLTATPGTYANFNDLVVNSGEIALFTYDNVDGSVPVKSVVYNVSTAISAHNTANDTHADIRTEIATKEPALPATPENPETKFLNGNREWTEAGTEYTAGTNITITNGEIDTKRVLELTDITIADGTPAIKIKTTAGGKPAVAEGAGATASGDNSHAEGDETTASGSTSHAEGWNTTASGNNSHAEGGGTTASRNNSHAEGGATTASGYTSHAEGNSTTASGSTSHAEGNFTTASGENSHAEGNSTTASGENSHSEGSQTIANHKCQHVFGEYNIADPSLNNASTRGTYIEIVGNGATSSAMSNARTLDWSGNETLAGKITANGVNLNDALNLKQAALGFTPENVANKKTGLAENSDSYYPTQKAVKTAVDVKVTGAASSTVGYIAVAKDTSGKSIKYVPVTVDDSGNVVISGNATINGTLTTINSETLQVKDKNIEIAKVDTLTDDTADGGGITLLGATNKTITWVKSKLSWVFNQAVEISGNLNVIGNIAVSGTVDGRDVSSDGLKLDTTVVGPASSVANEVAVYDGTTGKALKSGSGVSAVDGNLTATNDMASATKTIGGKVQMDYDTTTDTLKFNFL